jgi:folate-binding Fe-S cluster repair protein YgfZ
LPEEIIAVLKALTTQLTMYAFNSDVSIVGMKPKSKTRMWIKPTTTRINMAK